jgi:hypothetical protein
LLKIQARKQRDRLKKAIPSTFSATGSLVDIMNDMIRALKKQMYDMRNANRVTTLDFSRLHEVEQMRLEEEFKLNYGNRDA